MEIDLTPGMIGTAKRTVANGKTVTAPTEEHQPY